MTKFALLALALSGCSSLVDGACQDGYVRDDGSCVARVAGDPDGGVPGDDGGGGSGSDGGGSGSDGGGSGSDGGGSGSDGGPVVDAGPLCMAPEVACNGVCMTFESDPDNCGSCGYECASGICTAGHCEGEPYGHVVAIGHDYTSSHSSQRRVLANAVSLGATYDVAVSYWPGQSPRTAYRSALATAMTAINRPWHTVTFPMVPSATALDGIDVVVVSPESGSGDEVEATAAGWATTFDAFLHKGGVVVVLDGAGGQNHRFGHGAGLFEVDAPVTVTGQPTAVANSADAVADQVIAPYLAESSSVAFPQATQPVVTTTGGTVVFHLTR